MVFNFSKKKLAEQSLSYCTKKLVALKVELGLKKVLGMVVVSLTSEFFKELFLKFLLIREVVRPIFFWIKLKKKCSEIFEIIKAVSAK